MTIQITFETIKSGQPKPYAASEGHYKATFMMLRTFGPEEGKWMAWESIQYDRAKAYCKLCAGWTEKEEGDWASTRLVSFERDAHEHHVFTWETRTPFTD